MGFCHPYPSAKDITDKGENKIRCMRVLFNLSMFMASLLKPEQSIIEKPFLLKKPILPLPCNCSTTYIRKNVGLYSTIRHFKSIKYNHIFNRTFYHPTYKQQLLFIEPPTKLINSHIRISFNSTNQIIQRCMKEICNLN